MKIGHMPIRIAAIVAGRMKSSRLACKAILPIAGVSSVERCLEQCLGIRGVEQVILATSDLESDKILEKHLLGGRAKIWKGHPDDVIDRYLGACDNFGVDVVVRVTADCPIVLPDIVEYLLEKHFESGADYTAAGVCAVGTSGEIINTSALRKIIHHFGSAVYSEYMTWYFRNNPEHFRLNIIDLPESYVRNYRLTLDYAEDLEMFEMLFSKFRCATGAYRAQEVFSVLDANPNIAKINSHLTLKYQSDKQLVALLDEETRMI
jgi:N,N'-diacetyllegionaminate synthase